MLGADEFCTQDAHHEGTEVFGSQKRKPDTPIIANEEIHRLDTINFFWPHSMKRVTKAQVATLPTIVEEVKTSIEEVQPLPRARTDVHRITTVQESRVNEMAWHIARVPKTSAKAYWAKIAVTKNKCTAHIILYGKSTSAPIYSRLLRNVRKNHEEHLQFFFCADDIERCIKCSRHKWVISYSNTLERPSIPTLWPIKIGTNLTRSKIKALENAGFQLPQRECVTPS